MKAWLKENLFKDEGAMLLIIKYFVIVMLFMCSVVNAVTDEYKKELINRFVPNMVLDSRDITRNGNQVEPEPVEIMAYNSRYIMDIIDLNGVQCRSDHGIGPVDMFKNLKPVGRLYWTKSSTGYMANSYQCAVGGDLSCKEPNTKFADYLENPYNCNTNPFCVNGLYGVFYYQYFDWAGLNPDEWKNTYDQQYDNYNPTVYATFFETQEHYVVQYYYFFPFNDFANDHEGDWENINVYMLKNNTHVIDKIDYMFHHRYWTIKNDNDNKGKMDLVAGHPIIYTGGYAFFMAGNEYVDGYTIGLGGTGSHGLFPYPADYEDVETFCRESVDGMGKIIKWNDFDIKYALEDRGNDNFYLPVLWGRSANLGWVNDFCAVAIWIPGCADAVGQKPPPTRTYSGRWKKTASETVASIEKVEEYAYRPERNNKNAFNKLSTGITAIVNLLLLE